MVGSEPCLELHREEQERPPTETTGATRGDSAYLLSQNMFQVAPISMSHPRQSSAYGLRELPMCDFEKDCPSLDLVQVSRHARLAIHTVGDGACALHSLLGEHVLDGSIVCAPEGVAVADLRRDTWYYARVYALSKLEQHMDLFVSCARQRMTSDVRSQLSAYCTEESARLNEAKDNLGRVILELVRTRDLCTEEFFADMKVITADVREMQYEEFRAHLSPEVCVKAYETTRSIRDLFHSVAGVSSFNVLNVEIEQTTQAVELATRRFFWEGAGAAAHRQRFVSRGYYLVDADIDALAQVFDKKVVLMDEAGVCRIMNGESRNLRVILQTGNYGDSGCHFSLLRQSRNTLQNVPSPPPPPPPQFGGLQQPLHDAPTQLHEDVDVGFQTALARSLLDERQGQSQTRNSPEGKLDQRTSSNALQNMPSPPPPPQQRNNVPPLQLHEDEEFQTRLAMEVCEEDEQESAHDLQQPLSDAPLQLHGDIPVRDVLQQKPGKPVDVPRTDGCFFSALLAASSTTFSFSSVEFFRETVFDPPRVSTTMRGFAQAACASDNADGKYTTVKEWQDWHRKSLTSADSHAISWTAEFLRVQINIVELTKEGTRSVKQITPTTVQHTVWLQQFGGTHLVLRILNTFCWLVWLMSEIFWHKTDAIVKDLKLVKTSDWSQNTTLCMVFGLFLPTKGPLHGSNIPESRFSAHMARYGPKKPPKKVKIPVFRENRLFCL